MTTVDLAGVCTGPGVCDTSPVGTPGGRQNWVDKRDGLPAYVRAVAHAMRRKGDSESTAIARAVAIIKRWAAGRDNVTPETRARAAKALAQWEAMKSTNLTAAPVTTVDLAADPVFSTNDGPNLTIPAGPHRYRHGWVRIDAATPTAVERATRAVTTDGHALLHGDGMVPAAHRVIERVKAAGHKPSVKRVDIDGTPHLHIARSATSDYTATPTVTVDLAWNEALHPRNPKGSKGGGKFAAKTGGSSSSSAPPADMAANIRDFQRRNHLPVTGVVDTATAAKIRQTLTAKAGGGKGAKRKAARAAARAVKQRVAQHVATVNAMTPAQRATARNRMPVPPTGYVWTPTNTLRRFRG